MSKDIFTIGYAGYELSEFLDMLKGRKMNCVVDVRSVPYSKRYSQFNKEGLGTECAKQGLRYIYLGEMLGARRTEKQFLFPDGKVDFNKVSKSESFQRGMGQLVHLAETVDPVVIMCAEKDPFKCHRFVMLGKMLKSLDFSVVHIQGENLLRQEDLEDKLLKEYIPDFRQVSLFGPAMDRDEALNKAYEMRNKDISIVIY